MIDAMRTREWSGWGRWLWPLTMMACGRIGFDDRAPIVGDPRCALAPTPATGVEYFVGPSGSDLATGTTAATAWATFDHAWTIVGPGDTLTILDGVYLQALRPASSGAPGSPILIRAQHDGGAVIDGEDVREACAIVGSTNQHISDIDLEGVYCK